MSCLWIAASEAEGHVLRNVVEFFFWYYAVQTIGASRSPWHWKKSNEMTYRLADLAVENSLVLGTENCQTECHIHYRLAEENSLPCTFGFSAKGKLDLKNCGRYRNQQSSAEINVAGLICLGVRWSKPGVPLGVILRVISLIAL